MKHVFEFYFRYGFVALIIFTLLSTVYTFSLNAH